MQHPGPGNGNGREWEMQSSTVMKEQWVHFAFPGVKRDRGQRRSDGTGFHAMLSDMGVIL